MMIELYMYRMPDDEAGSSWALSLNGVALGTATTARDNHALPFANMPRHLLALAVRLERALHTRIQYTDRRIRRSSINLHVRKS